MTPPATWLPAWLLACLPVALARVCTRQVIEAGQHLAPATRSNASALPPARQLLVDVSVIYQGDARTGIQRVVRALLLQLLLAPPAGYVVRPVFATRYQGYRYAAVHFLTQDSAISSEASSVQAQNLDIFLCLDLAAHLLPRHQAQVLSWKRAGVKVHVLVYDLLPLQHPEWFNPKTTSNFRRWIRWLATYADSAICISESVRAELLQDLRDRFGLDPATLPATRISLGADIDATAPSKGLPPRIEAALARLRSTHSLLMVGTVEPRKGHDQVLAAFDLLLQARIETSTPTSSTASGTAVPMLVIVGCPGWKTDSLQQQLRQHPQASKQIIWFEDASDELLLQLYASCTAVIVASRGEGFGLPMVEAALHGKPIIARDLPVFKELKLPTTTYFHGDSPDALANAVLSCLETARTADELNTAGPGEQYRLTGATWATAAAELVTSLGLPANVDLRQTQSTRHRRQVVA